jgi:hypothetical protein
LAGGNRRRPRQQAGGTRPPVSDGCCVSDVGRETKAQETEL